LERPALVWERDILPVRIADYRHDLLDQLTLSGAFVWGRVGGDAGVPDDGAVRPGGPPPIAFLGRGDLDWLRAPADDGAAGEPLGGPARAALAALASRGALFVDELARLLQLAPPAVLAALWELARAGLLTSDGFHAVRLLGSLEGRRGLRRAARPEAAPSRAALRLRVSLRTLPGRWSLLSPGDADADARAEAWADLLLARYGIVFREVRAEEPGAPPWRELAAVYRRREFAGTIRRGLFVQPGSGEQYGLPAAVDHLRDVRRRPDTRWLVLSAADPVLAHGGAEGGPRLVRHPGHLVVMRGGRACLGLEGTRLWAAPELALAARDEALGALVAERRGRRLVVETVEDQPALASPWLAVLADLGFHSDGECLTFDGYPGPRPRPRPAA